MKYTNNYHLPQWSEDDLILMNDFNQMNTNIENGIDTARSEAAEAQADAASAKVVANAAKNTAEAALSQKPYVVGTYVGNGQDMYISLGFRPSFVIISGMVATLSTNTTEDFDRYFGMTAGNIMTSRLAFTGTGFMVRRYSLENGYYPNFTINGRRYDYIAFK